MLVREQLLSCGESEIERQRCKERHVDETLVEGEHDVLPVCVDGFVARPCDAKPQSGADHRAPPPDREMLCPARSSGQQMRSYGKGQVDQGTSHRADTCRM